MRSDFSTGIYNPRSPARYDLSAALQKRRQRLRLEATLWAFIKGCLVGSAILMVATLLMAQHATVSASRPAAVWQKDQSRLTVVPIVKDRARLAIAR